MTMVTLSVVHRDSNLRVAAWVVTSIVIIFLSGCSHQYHIVNFSTPAKARYNTYFIMEADTGPELDKTLNLIIDGLENCFENIGLRKDSLNPELLLLARRESHQVGRFSSASTKAVMQTYSITNPVYSPFENTSDQLQSNSCEGNIRYYDKELFYRIQAVDAVKNELVWSVKIYPHKPNGIALESMEGLIQSLMRSFTEGQLNNSKTKKQ